jgi:exopolysaccharide production protein ExoQ
MNNLSTSKPSRSQNTWSSLPWGIFIFLLAVFVFSTPLYRNISFSGIAIDDSLAVSNVMNRDNLTRIIALIALGAFALFNLLRFKPGRFQINGLLGWLILFYLVWATLSIIWSIDPRFTTKRMGILLLLSLGALYVAARFSFQETITLVFFICAVAVLGGFVTELRTHNFLPFYGWWRFGGNLPPILQAWHCGLLVLSAIALAKTAEQNRAVYLGIAFIAFVFLILTRSRGAFVSCFMASAIYWSLATPKRHQSALLFFGIIIVGCLMYFLLGYQITIGISDIALMLGRTGEMETLGSLTGRIPLWKAAMELVKQHPFVGYGYDAFLTSQNLIFMEKKLGWVTPSPHSGYIATLGGLGYIGAVTLVLSLFLSVMKSISLRKRNLDYAFILAVLVWLILNLYTEDQLLGRPYFPVFVWMIMFARLGFIREER